MNYEERMWWERVRSRGKWRFILLYFGVALGFSLGTLLAVVTRIYTDGLSLAAFTGTRFLIEWALRLVIGFITACLFGVLMWRQNEKRYQGR